MSEETNSSDSLYTTTFAKLSAYCAYQDRCEAEVKEKAFSYELPPEMVGLLIRQLKEENFLNEMRFVESVVRGKFYHKKWGKLKIRHFLKQKGVAETYQKQGLQLIDEDDYRSTLSNLLEKKKAEVAKGSGPLSYAQKAKVMRFAAQRGFENFLVQELLNQENER